MNAIIQIGNSYFLRDTETKEEIKITKEEFRSEYFHNTELPYVNDKYEIVYVIKECK